MIGLENGTTISKLDQVDNDNFTVLEMGTSDKQDNNSANNNDSKKKEEKKKDKVETKVKVQNAIVTKLRE